MLNSTAHRGGGKHFEILRTRQILSQKWSGQYSKNRIFQGSILKHGQDMSSRVYPLLDLKIAHETGGTCEPSEHM